MTTFTRRIPIQTRRGAIGAIMLALQCPAWARPNLDALADVLRDLSWLPEGPVGLPWRPSPLLPAEDRRAIEAVLVRAVAESAGSARPVTLLS